MIKVMSNGKPTIVIHDGKYGDKDSMRKTIGAGENDAIFSFNK